MTNLPAIIASLISAKSRNVRPYMTPGWNGATNPMALPMPGQQTQAQAAQTPSPIPPGGQPTAPAQQGLIRALLSNPQIMQGLTQLALSQGKYGGARGAGFQNQVALNNEMARKREDDAERQRQFNEQIALERSRGEETTRHNKAIESIQSATANDKDFAAVIKYASERGMDPVVAGAYFGITKPEDVARLRALADEEKRLEEKNRYYIDMTDPAKPKFVPTKDVKDVDDPNLYVGDRRKELPSQALARLKAAGKENERESKLLSPEEEAQQIRLRKASGRSAMADQDPEVYADALGKGELTVANVPEAVRDRAIKIAKKKGYQILSDTERQKLTDFKKVKPVLSSISELSERINTQQGVYAAISGGAERAKAKANLNDDVAEYESLVSGFTPLVARALGHTGVLTQQDVDSVRAMFPKPGDSKSLRNRKIKRLESLIGGVQAEMEAGTTQPIGGAPSQATKPAPSRIKILKVE